MNVVETLNLARDMAKVDNDCNLELLNFFHAVLLTEAKVMDSGELRVIEEATDVIYVLSFLLERCVGKKNIFASKIIREGYEKLQTLTDDWLFCQTFIFVTGELSDDEIIKQREYLVSEEGLREYLKALNGKDEEEDGES